jgi:hypothetical protein
MCKVKGLSKQDEKYSLSAALRHRWYATWRTCTSGGSASLVEKHNIICNMNVTRISSPWPLANINIRIQECESRRAKIWHCEYLNLSSRYAIDVTIFLLHTNAALLCDYHKRELRGAQVLSATVFRQERLRNFILLADRKELHNFLRGACPRGRERKQIYLARKISSICHAYSFILTWTVTAAWVGKMTNGVWLCTPDKDAGNFIAPDFYFGLWCNFLWLRDVKLWSEKNLCQLTTGSAI